MILAMWRVLIELAPWLLLGAAFAGALYALLPPGAMSRMLGGRGAVWKSVLVGIPLPLCSCAVIPVGLGLKRQGASDGASVAFLIATPQTGVDSVLVTAGMLGWPLALFKVLIALVTGVVGGWATDRFAARPAGLPIVEPPPAATPRLSWADRLRRGATHADDLVRSIWLWLVLGVAISAALTVWLPTEWLTGLAAYGALASMGAALALSLPLYVCATASVPIAASLVAGGLPLGAVIVFLMAGPATNTATIGAVSRALGGRAVAVYLTTIILGSVLGGWLFERLLADHFAVAPEGVGHTHGHAAAWWEVAAAAVLGVWLAACAVREAASRWLIKPAHSGEPQASMAPSMAPQPPSEGGGHACCHKG
ncbi:permease [Botrimarina sp.]|uniref:permease n=1 Tax=Botrimarina sp. TaxID=2795802 RepID=UPI0032EB3C6B